MAYTPKTWVTGETIDASELNHMEQGIAEISANGAIGTANIAGGAVTLAKLADAAKEHFALAEDFSKIYVNTANIYNQATDFHGINLSSTGVPTEDATKKTSDYIEIGANNKFTIQRIIGKQSRVFFFTTDSTDGFSRALWITTSGESATFLLSATEKYIRIALQEDCPDFMMNIGDTLLPYEPYGGKAGTFLQGVIDGINDKIDTEAESLRESSAQKNVLNRFNKSKITAGKYINVSNGSLSSNDAFFASDFIYIEDLESVTVSYTHIFGWYDANKAWLGHPDNMNSGNADLTFARPENAVYLRFSAYNSSLNLAQVGTVSRANYYDFGKYVLPDYVQIPEKIIVDASGGGDYTSLTRALYENVDSGVEVVVKQGTYNIVTEYVDIFGLSAVDSMADADTAIFNGFQFGAIIRNRKITFEAGSHVVCDWTGHTVNGTHRFSALRVDYNCEIIGLDLLSIGTFYAIHDDYGVNVPYTVKYENCRVEGRNLTNANCIGGGCKNYSRHILKNCYFNNNLTGSATVRYHNTNAEGAEPEIYVSNCYFNNWFTPRWYGPQTSKMRVYVNNCEARAIYKTAESSSYNVDNVELYKWCNTETSPIEP